MFGFPIKNRLESGFSDFGSGLKSKNCSGFRASGWIRSRRPNNCSSWTTHIPAPFFQPCHPEQLFGNAGRKEFRAVGLSGFGLRVLTHLVVRGMSITICGHEKYSISSQLPLPRPVFPSIFLQVGGFFRKILAVPGTSRTIVLLYWPGFGPVSVHPEQLFHKQQPPVAAVTAARAAFPNNCSLSCWTSSCCLTCKKK